MIKLIYPDANEELLTSCEGSLSRVITSDLKNIKEASSNSITKEMLEECKPDKDHFLIHFIGVGDYEKYGFNKNADAFTKEANEKYHKTFEQGGHLFREHKSDNPEVNAIGQIKKAMYNPEMGRIELAVWGNIKKAAQEYEDALAGKPLSCSMGCFPRGSKITMEDGSYKNIEEIKINDIVRSGSNNASKIVDIFNYKYSGNKISLQAIGLTEPIVCTGNHPIFIRRYTTSLLQDAPAVCPVCGAHVKYLKTHIKDFKDDSHKAFWNTYKEALSKYEEKFVDADQIQAGDYLVSICALSNKSNNDLMHTSQFIENNLCYHKISNISIENVNDFEVFNLEVENDHTYLAQNIIVHNCSIKFDRDSITGKLCANPSQYEPHMKKHAGQYIPEYKKYAFVYNDTPKFFDLSIVKRPAERIAHYLEYKFANDNTKDLLKTASSNGCIPSALLAEIEGIKYSLLTKFANSNKTSLLETLKQKENEFADVISNQNTKDNKSLFIKGAAIHSFSKDYELTDSEINGLNSSGIKPESFFREMAKRASVLSFNSFINYIYPEKDETKDAAIKIASTCMLPGLFNGLESFGIDINSLEDLFNSGSAIDCISDNTYSDPIQKLMDQVSEKFSIDDDKKEKRIINITIINGEKDKNSLDQVLPNILKSASEIDTNSLLYNKAKKYAASYAVYKIAAINDIEKFKGEKLNDASLYSLIAQNYIYNI